MKVQYFSASAAVEGWRFLWMKRVTGFDASRHCARCLLGEYVEAVGLDMPVSTLIDVPAEPGDVFYWCGVATPYRWKHNAHLALAARDGGGAVLHCYNGDVLVVTGAEQIPFDDKAARALFPERSKAFLTCRNFQFGAARFGRPPSRPRAGRADADRSLAG
jgi:hypothetical protein